MPTGSAANGYTGGTVGAGATVPLNDAIWASIDAGDPEAAETQTPYARAMLAGLRSGGYAGAITYLDIGMTGTLADLAHSRADLAIIALGQLPAHRADRPDPRPTLDDFGVLGSVKQNADVVLETGIQNLTQDEAPALLHQGKDRSGPVLLVRLQAPAEEQK